MNWQRLIIQRMSPILHLYRHLQRPPAAMVVPGINVRPIDLPHDVDAWLRLHSNATADLVPRVRPWTRADFFTQMVRQPWWRADRMWIASATGGPASEATGAVTLALRAGRASSVPVIHWLFVDPAWRRRGIGRLLLAQLEQAAWDDGWREVHLETHARWIDALKFYQSAGYAPLRDV